ncbi:MAG: molybdenum cofactor guanylyltransferase [Thermodesulfobacteriota bacterium]|nr:molybdenum cofactor guanylyltransferase [Thermodesulfobacteriota bacterium]
MVSEQSLALDRHEGPSGKKYLITGVTGVILAGGLCTRFGSNKALAELNGRTLIEHAAEILNQLFYNRLLVTTTPDVYGFLGWLEIGDTFVGAGPLAGIHAALKQIRTRRAFITACDMPFPDAGLIRYLCDLPGEWDVVLPWPDSGPEPLFAVYSRDIVSVVEKKLIKHEKKVGLLFEDLRVRRVTGDEIFSVAQKNNTFHNVNRPEDMPKR